MRGSLTATSALSIALAVLGCAEDRPAADDGEAATKDGADGPAAMPESAPAPDATAATEAAADAAPSVAKQEPATAALPSWPPREVVPDPGGDYIYSKVRHLWIRPMPNSKAWIGYLSLGSRVRVKDGDRAAAHLGMGGGGGCEDWYRVEPFGVVCTGRDATLDPNDPDIVVLRERAADAGSPWPYRYGESLQVPVYHEPPDAEKQRNTEEGLQAHLDKLAAGELADEERFAGVDFSRAGKGPPTLLELPPGGKPLQTRIALGSTLAYVDEFDFADRTFLLAWDGGIVPKDKVRPFPEVRFHGLVLDDDQRLPIGFFRGHDGRRYRRADGAFTAHGTAFPRLSHVALNGKQESVGEITYWETRDGDWVSSEDVTVAEERSELPPRVQSLSEGSRTWLDISILGGTLVAYEHDKPVYATLISPGRGGIPQPGVPTLDTASTPTGTYSVLGKFLTATMVSGSNSSLIHAEVQYTQNFSGPYALHGAYWHDRWGEKKSGGCVNLSPIDSQRIFAWTEPQLPAGWHGMRTIARDAPFATPTVVVLRR